VNKIKGVFHDRVELRKQVALLGRRRRSDAGQNERSRIELFVA